MKELVIVLKLILTPSLSALKCAVQKIVLKIFHSSNQIYRVAKNKVIECRG